MLTKKQKLIGAVALAVVVTIVFGLTKLTLPLKTIVWQSLAVFAVFLLMYPWVWKPRKFTFRRTILMALFASGVSAAILVTSNLLASYLYR